MGSHGRTTEAAVPAVGYQRLASNGTKQLSRFFPVGAPPIALCAGGPSIADLRLFAASRGTAPYSVRSIVAPATI